MVVVVVIMVEDAPRGDRERMHILRDVAKEEGKNKIEESRGR